MKQAEIIVVGAGLAGLSCAHELALHGRRVLLLEAKPYPGGRTSSFSDDGMPVESGLHRYIGYYSALPRLLKQCGVRLDDIIVWEDTAEVRLTGGRKLVLGLAPLLAPLKTLRGLLGNRDCLTARDKLSLLPFFAAGFASYPFSSKLDRVSVTEYANRHHVTERAKRRILEPLSSGIFFLPPEAYSAYAFFGLFAPAISKFYKMRLGAFRGGMSDVLCDPIVRRIRALGGEVRFNTEVERVLAEGGTVTGVETADGQTLRAARTVIATTLPQAKRILAPLRGHTALRSLFALPTMSACTLQLELSRPALPKDVTTFAPGTDLVSFAEQSRSTFRGSRGRLSLILGNAHERCGQSMETLREMALEQLARLGVPLDGAVVAARKVAEENGFYALTPGSQRLRPPQVTGIPGLTLAGDYTRTKSFATMEGAVLSGRLAARSLLSTIQQRKP